MKPIAETSVMVLRWSLTGNTDSELVAGDDVVASLKWARDWGTQATGESSDGSWTFRREGLLHPRVIAKIRGLGVEAATAKLSWGGSVVIDIAGGEEFRLHSGSLRRPDWVLTDSRRNRLLTLRWERSWTSDGATVILERSAKDVTALPLLNILSWYVVLLASYDYDAGAIATSAAAGAI